MGNKLVIEKTEEKTRIVLTLEGRLDSETAPKLQEEILKAIEECEDGVVVDIFNLGYVSSAGLRVFLMSEKRCKAAQKAQTIRGANEAVKEIFDITGFASFLNII
ncbi:MAG: STAS domain-containing protein [Oscillospiraceae bacterium]|nr:STAS domain-containing protein [Oscillospiraceae bacterium]